MLIKHFLFLISRLREISEESTIPQVQPRRRSNSLPIPQIEISLYQGGSGNSRDSPSNSSLTTKDYIEVPDQSVPHVVDKTEETNGTKKPGEKKKKVKMADLRTLIETKILSKSDRGLEKIGSEVVPNTSGNNGNGKPLMHAVSKTISMMLFMNL